MIDVVIPITNKEVFTHYDAFVWGVRKQVVLWFEEHGGPILSIMQDHDYIFRFYDKEVALLFKLTWG